MPALETVELGGENFMQQKTLTLASGRHTHRVRRRPAGADALHLQQHVPHGGGDADHHRCLSLCPLIRRHPPRHVALPAGCLPARHRADAEAGEHEHADLRGGRTAESAVADAGEWFRFTDFTVDCANLTTLEARPNSIRLVSALRLAELPALKEVSLAGCAAHGLEEIALHDNPALTTFYKERCSEALKSIELDRGAPRHA